MVSIHSWLCDPPEVLGRHGREGFCVSFSLRTVDQGTRIPGVVDIVGEG